MLFENRPNEVVLRFSQVHERTGLGRSHIHGLAARGRFPKPIKLSARASGWLASEVDEWLAARKAARDAQPPSANPNYKTVSRSRGA